MKPTPELMIAGLAHGTSVRLLVVVTVSWISGGSSCAITFMKVEKARRVLMRILVTMTVSCMEAFELAFCVQGVVSRRRGCRLTTEVSN